MTIVKKKKSLICKNGEGFQEKLFAFKLCKKYISNLFPAETITSIGNGSQWIFINSSSYTTKIIIYSRRSSDLIKTVTTPKPTYQLSSSIETSIPFNYIPLQATWKFLSSIKKNSAKTILCPVLKLALEFKPVVFVEVDLLKIKGLIRGLKVNECAEAMEPTVSQWSTILILILELKNAVAVGNSLFR